MNAPTNWCGLLRSGGSGLVRQAPSALSGIVSKHATAARNTTVRRVMCRLPGHGSTDPGASAVPGRAIQLGRALIGSPGHRVTRPYGFVCRAWAQRCVATLGHTFASRLLAAGVDLRTVRELRQDRKSTRLKSSHTVIS